MSNTKFENDMEATTQDTDDYMLHLPRPLNLEEKKYLLAVERGDLPNVKRLLQLANKGKVNINSDSSEINARVKLFLNKTRHYKFAKCMYFFFKRSSLPHLNEKDNFLSR